MNGENKEYNEIMSEEEYHFKEGFNAGYDKAYKDIELFSVLEVTVRNKQVYEYIKSLEERMADLRSELRNIAGNIDDLVERNE